MITGDLVRSVGPRDWRRRKSEVADVLDTALSKIARSEPISDHDREWAQAIRYWLAGADEEAAVSRVRQERNA